MQSQQPQQHHPVYFGQNCVTVNQPQFQTCNVRRHLYQNFSPSPPANGFLRSPQQTGCQPNFLRPMNPPGYFKPWLNDDPPPASQLQSGNVRPSGILRPSVPGHYATVICQQPSKHPKNSGLPPPVTIHHNHPVDFIGGPVENATTMTNTKPLHDFPHSSHMGASNTRDPYLQGPPQTACRRNPPPPPPPRSNSWLGRTSGDTSAHIPSHVTPATHHPIPYPMSTTAPESYVSGGRHMQSYPAPSGGNLESHQLQRPLGGVGMRPQQCSNNCLGNQMIRTPDNSTSRCRSFMTNNSSHPSVISEATSATDSSQHTNYAARVEVTDTLLRLLICHYTTTSDPETPPHDPSILDRLLCAVCGTNRRLGSARFVNSDVASLAQKILPHLIRIIYTEVLANTTEAGDGVDAFRNRTSSKEVVLESTDQRATGPTVGEPTDPSMTTSMESRHSCADDEDEDNLGDYDVETVLHRLEDKPGWTNGSELDALPPGTSIEELKSAAMEAICRLVPMCQPDSNLCERDLGIVRLLSTIQTYTAVRQTRLKQAIGSTDMVSPPRCPVAEVAALVRLSFYPEHRTAICELGGVHALIALLRAEQAASTDEGTDTDQRHDQSSSHHHETSLALRRYICMALTNLTFGVAENKALICRRVANLEALLAQLESGNEELKQVSASVLRNLCWRTDSRSKLALRRVNAPRRLTIAAMNAQRDSTLRTTLSALWNLSAHCSHNKRAVCSVDGVFSFLLNTMHCNDLNNRLVIVENSGGILRNVSAVVAGREDYRMLLNQNNCYPILIELLRHSPSLTVVVNVCGTLWNLTASPHCPTDDLVLLCRLGVVDLLHQLAQSPHELIRNSSTAVLRNLMNPPRQAQQQPATSRDRAAFEHRRASDSTQTDADPTESSTDDGLDVVEDDNPSNQTDQSYRRRMNARARLRFGLLSVVLEADDADEEAAEETYDNEDDEDEEEDTYEDEGSIYPDQEALVTDDSSDMGSRRVVVNSIGKLDPQQLANKTVSNDCAWHPSDTDDEQACVYAEEGTPYPPDSTTTSSLELCQQPTKLRDPSNEFYLDDPAYYTAVQPPMELTSYTSSEGLLHVYASEGTPSQLVSVSPSVASVSPPSEPHKLADQIDSQRTSGLDEEGPQLPSPPPDLSGLVSPLMTMHLNDFDHEVNTGFTLPPPPLQTVPDRLLHPVSTTESSAISPIETPLIFSRGTSSYLSSADLGDLPIGVQSSPQSEYSEQPLMNESDFADDVDTNLDSKSAISRRESGVDEEEEEEELLAPLTFSNGDGVEEGNEGEEVRLAFAEEGTPQDTRSSSVGESHLAFSNCNFEHSGRPQLHCAMYGWSNRNNHNLTDASNHLVDDPDDEDEQGQSHILQQCIASAMPVNTSLTLRTDVPSGQKFLSNHSAQIAPLFPQSDDTVQSFAVEDTPFGTSTKTSSASDLFALDGKTENLSDQHHIPDTSPEACKLPPHSEPCSSPGSAGRIGSSSSINGDTSSDLLSEVIQSAMPKVAQSGLNVCCPDSADGDCLQLYAVESIPGEDDFSESSSMQHTSSSGLPSFSTQPSLHCSSTTSPPVAAISGMGSTETGLSAPPAPPRRTTSVLSSQKDPFAPTSPVITRPQATVAPMPQVQQCSPITTDSVGPLKADRLVMSDGLRGTHRASLTPADKDDASSFSSLLSIESVGLEHSLLQECISSAMPRPKLAGPLRRQQHQLWEQIHAEFGPSDEAAQSGDHPDTIQEATIPDSQLPIITPAPPLHGKGFSAPATQLPSNGVCSSVDSVASSLGHKSAPSTVAGFDTSVQAQASFEGKTKRSSALHFLANGSGDAPHLPPCSTPTINNNEKSPDLVLVETSAGNVHTDGASSEATTDTVRRSSKLVPPSNVSQQGSLSVQESRLPCLKRVQPVSPQAATEVTSENGRVLTDHSSLAEMLAEGTQAILAALQTPAEGDGSHAEETSTFSTNASTRTSTAKTGLRIPTASVIPTRLAQPSRIAKPGGIPQVKSGGSKLDANHSSQLSSPSVTPVHVTKQPPKNNTVRTEKQVNGVATKQRRPTTSNTSVALSKTPTTQRSGLRPPAQHSIPSRLASTCPPSATGRSLLSSRASSVSGSQTNLHSRLVAPSQAVSAQSIYAALSKQERQATSKLAKPTSSVVSKYRYPSSASGISASSNSNNKALSSSNGQLPNMHSTSDRSPSSFGYNSSTPSLVNGDGGPKPVRGGRKSLTGRKPAAISEKTSTVGKAVARPNGSMPNPSLQTNALDHNMPPDSAGRCATKISSTVKPVHTSPSSKSSLTKLPSAPHSNSMAKIVATNSSSPINTVANCTGTTDSKSHSDSTAGMWIVRGELTMVERAS